MSDKIKKLNKKKLNEVSESPDRVFDVDYNNLVSRYFLELISILDIRMHTLSKSIRGREAIVTKIVPKLFEFVSEFTRPQFLKFFRETFQDFRLTVTKEDISDIIFAIRKFETKRDNLISKKSSEKKEIEIMDDLIKFIDKAVHQEIDDGTLKLIYHSIMKHREEYKNTDQTPEIKMKVQSYLWSIGEKLKKILTDFNFEEFYNDDDVSKLLEFIESNIEIPHFTAFRNKSLTSILLRLGVNLKSNVILKTLLSEMDTPTIEINKKRILIVFVEIFTQLFYPNSLKNGINLIEDVIENNFMVKEPVVKTEEIPQKKEFEDELKQAVSNMPSQFKNVEVSGVNDMWIGKVKLLSSESNGIIEFYVPKDRKFISHTYTSNARLMHDFNGDIVEPSNSIKRFENNELPPSEENYIVYLTHMGKIADEFFRYTIEKDFIPSSDSNSETVRVFRQLLKFDGFTFVELHNKDIDITKENVILPEFISVIPASQVQNIINKFQKK